MIHPTSDEVLATIRTGIERDIVPHLADTEARSAAATIGHLLRHVAIRFEDEGQLLADDIGRLRGVLGQAAGWFEGKGLPDAAMLRAALLRDLPQGAWPSPRRLGELALELRGALVAAQMRLQELRAVHGEEADYRDLRAAIRAYIAAQLADEARLIEPAFLGQGPRR